MPDERILKSIDGFSKSYSMIPKGTPGMAIAFVHGFAGSPTGTWCDFQGLSYEYRDEYSWWKDAALFFYSYDSLFTPILYNAVRLRSFLEAVLKSTKAASSMWQYTKLVLVGHSEGAVVIRRMILSKVQALVRQAQEQGLRGEELRKWIGEEADDDLILDSSIRLFAPACAGTNFSGAFAFVEAPSFLFAVLASSSVVRNELVRGSPILSSLQTGTESTHSEYPTIKALPAKILFGNHDHVVYTDKYACDEIVEPWAEGHGHRSVCKPKYVYQRPLEFVQP